MSLLYQCYNPGIIFESDISIFESDISIFESDISIFESDISIFESDISIFESDISVFESDISIFESDISMGRRNGRSIRVTINFGQSRYFRIKKKTFNRLLVFLINDKLMGFYPSQYECLNLKI